MAKRNKLTSEVELQDAIDRIGKKPEAKQSSQTSKAWQNYLIDVLDINLQAVSSEKGKDFWENVRQGMMEKHETEPTKQPTKKQVAEANAEVYSHVSYKQKGTGKFTKLTSIKDNLSNYIRIEYTSYRNKETGRFVKL